MGINVLSLFDGISCGQVALQRAGIEVDNYFASEVDKWAIQVTQKNFPGTIQLGDVREVRAADLPGIDMVLAGSPCQGFSFAGKQLAFDDPRSKLFFEFVRLLRECQPRWFLLENVRMKKEFRDVISGLVGREPVLINSAVLCAQNRRRLYWTNIELREKKLKHKDALIKDIIEKDIIFKGDTLIRVETFYKEKIKKVLEQIKPYLLFKLQEKHPRIGGLNITNNGIRPYKTDDDKSGISELSIISYLDTKSHTLIANHAPKILIGILEWRKLTPIECERLQTLPDNYTEGISNSQRYRALGNAWTVDVIVHLLRGEIPIRKADA